MAIRKSLCGHLIAAWQEVATVDYVRQRINSERSLQAAFWARLNARLPSQFRMFIEPHFFMKDANIRCIPDIVICNRRSIVVVIELKYRPRGPAAFRKDIRTLDLLARMGDSLVLSNSRFRGPQVNGREYCFAAKTLFAWGGFHRPPKGTSYKNLPPITDGYVSLTGRFLQLHAETRPDDCPIVYDRLS
jgi:hypothetical protein